MQRKDNILPWLALICLMIPMFASYFFDDMFSSVSQLFRQPENLELGWNSRDLGDFIGDYSLLCVCGGLVIGGILLDIYGIRIMGSVFMGMMLLGGCLATLAVSCGWPKEIAIGIGRVGRMTFGLGSEIAGVAVSRAIAKWFKGRGGLSFAMSLQLALARFGTALAIVAAPAIVGVPKEWYSLQDTARPAVIGMALLALGAVAWAIFSLMDAAADKASGVQYSKGSVTEENRFSFRDILALMKNGRFLLIGLLCVSFYCCVSSFKKFGTSVVIPRFGIEENLAGMMISMIPFCTIVFTPIFGKLVDRKGKASAWMLAGSLSVLAGHLTLAFAPQGMAVCGYAAIALLGLGYSIVPSAMWPSVPGIVPEKNLGTAFSLIYWIQNIGLFFVPKIVGRLFTEYSGLEAVMKVEYLFIALGVFAMIIALILRKKL